MVRQVGQHTVVSAQAIISPDGPHGLATDHLVRETDGPVIATIHRCLGCGAEVLKLEELETLSACIPTLMALSS